MTLFVPDKSRSKSKETLLPLTGELDEILGNYSGVFPLQMPIVSTEVNCEYFWERLIILANESHP